MEALTTPELIESDSVFPGENWFFYWKTSPSLWEEKLSSYQGPSPIFVPVHWGLHSEYIDQFDFGQNRPETDLNRLLKTAKALGKEMIFLIPLGPAPFLVNAGVPSYLARDLAWNQHSMAIGVLDNQGQVNKMYSFYGPRIYQGFRKFIWHLGQFISQTGNDAPIYALNSFRLTESIPESFFDDHSRTYADGLNRYIKQLHDSAPEKIERLMNDSDYEKVLAQEYSEIVKGLYVDVVKEFLAANYQGHLNVCFLGTANRDIFKRSSSLRDVKGDYFSGIQTCLNYEMIPCSILINRKFKEGALEKKLQDIVNSPYLMKHLGIENYDEDEVMDFSLLSFFEFIAGKKNHYLNSRMELSGVKDFLEETFPSSYVLNENLEFEVDELDERKIFFFYGHCLDEMMLKKLKQVFLSGAKVFLDTYKFSDQLRRNLEIFFAENSLESEKINFICDVEKYSLGEGALFLYDTQKLMNCGLTQKRKFWNSMVDYLGLNYLQIEGDKDVFYIWKKRCSSTFELDYEEIRRVCFYNPTSYKKRIHILSNPRFAFLKSVDQVSVTLKTGPRGVDIEMKPGGHIGLDYGHFE